MVGLPSSRSSSVGFRPPCVSTELKRGVLSPRRRTKPGRRGAGCGSNRQRRGCRDSGAEGDRTNGLDDPSSARRPAVPTRRGRGGAEPQPEGRVNASLPPCTSAAAYREPPTTFLALQSMGPAGGGGGCWTRRWEQPLWRQQRVDTNRPWVLGVCPPPSPPSRPPSFLDGDGGGPVRMLAGRGEAM